MDQEEPTGASPQHLPRHHPVQSDDGMGVKGRAVSRPAQAALCPHCHHVAGCKPCTGDEQLRVRVSDHCRTLLHGHTETQEDMGAVAAQRKSFDWSCDVIACRVRSKVYPYPNCHVICTISIMMSHDLMCISCHVIAGVICDLSCDLW